MNKNPLLFVLGIAVIPIGCTFTPKYVRPEVPVPAAWPTGAAYAESAATANASDPQQLRWQDFVTDAKLQQVIGMALANNRDLRLAALNVELARAMYGIQRAQLLPVVNATGSGSKQRLPGDLSGTGKAETVEVYGASLGVAAWEIDFFGRIRSLRDRALEEYLATEQARRSAQILLVSSVANAYMAFAADRESLAVAETTLATQIDTYTLVKGHADIGLGTDLDLYRAQAQVETARRGVARYTQQVAQDANALDLLLGTPAPRELLPAALGNVAPVKELDAGLSSEVLLQRPDVLQAENRLKAANADIGAARSAFFPRISLTAAVGTASRELSGLFKSGSGTWNYAPQMVMPIFDARTWSAFKAAKVQRKMAVTQYEKAIQSAFREVADALAVRGTIGQELLAQQSLVDVTAASYRLSAARYLGGIDNYLSVLDAQRSLYVAQQGLILLRLTQFTSLLHLYSALGGGAM